ncbi:tetratricopeptide repeat protein [Aneurinibacillus tyrosinisolvens]|uniref:tetratricopeptide repeat protein n=1 Tax=Aneurinibacillus tyrosinisolvens TaxID=1443435 RepID=UPI00063F6981|nr:DnaJ domain-containing protein [Aneurinibacillus tyrosinisolvens]
MAGAKAENYYKVLGTRSNIKQENIKKKYIEMVKKFPPETHPEQFERIREAYEVLRDPKKRHEYDAMRKHGNKIEKLMEKGEAYVQTEEWEQARSIYQQAVNIMPDSISARMGLAGALLHLHDVDAFEEQYTHILPLIPEGMEIPVYMSRAMIYMEIGKPEKAYDIFKDTCERFPDRIYESLRILVSAYLVADLDEEAWELLVSHLPDPGQEKAEDIHLFIFWVHTMARLNKWNLWSQLQTRIRKF